MEQGLLIVAIILQIGVGVYILTQDPLARVNRLFAWGSLSFALGAFAVLLSSLSVGATAAAHLVVMYTIAVYIWSGMAVGLCMLTMSYPQWFRGQRVWMLYALIGIAVIATCAVLVFYVRLPEKAAIVASRAEGGIHQLDDAIFPVQQWGIAYCVAGALICLALLVGVIVRRPGRDRQLAVMLGGLVLPAWILAVVGPQVLPGVFRSVVPVLDSVVLLAVLGYVIVRYRRTSVEERALRLVLDIVSEGMLVLQSDGSVVSCNARGADVLGLPMQRIVRTPIDQVLAHSPLPDGLWHELKAGLEQGGDWSREVRYRVDDAERVVANQVVSVYDGRGDVQGHLWLFRDLTELRHSQGLVEAQNRELQTAIAELDNSRRVYSQLLETVRTLAAPAVPVLEGIIVMPLSGQIDSERAQRILDNLLAGIVEQQAKIAIIDITGVPVVDTAVAEYLIQAARAASLMGCRSLLVGIRPEIAQVIVELGIDMSGLMTFGDLQGGVEYALRALGMTLEYVPDARRRETAR